jgi:hypothetical protein
MLKRAANADEGGPINFQGKGVCRNKGVESPVISHRRRDVIQLHSLASGPQDLRTYPKKR